MSDAPDSKTTEFGTGAVRSSDAKHLSFTSLPLVGLLAVARTAGEGAAKYGRYNYMLGMPAHDMIDHSMRHIVMFLLGDRSEPHLPHAAWGLLAAIQSLALDPEISAPHLLGPGATVGPEMRSMMSVNALDLKVRREAGEFADAGSWNLNDLKEIATILEQRHVAKIMEAVGIPYADDAEHRERCRKFDEAVKADWAEKELTPEAEQVCKEAAIALGLIETDKRKFRVTIEGCTRIVPGEIRQFGNVAQDQGGPWSAVLRTDHMDYRASSLARDPLFSQRTLVISQADWDHAAKSPILAHGYDPVDGTIDGIPVVKLNQHQPKPGMPTPHEITDEFYRAKEDLAARPKTRTFYSPEEGNVPF